MVKITVFDLCRPGQAPMPKDRACTHPEEHPQHLCELKKHLTKGELNLLRKNPRYVCANCGGKVNQGRNLCVPKRMKE